VPWLTEAVHFLRGPAIGNGLETRRDRSEPVNYRFTSIGIVLRHDPPDIRTGGVVSSLGKGIASASLAAILEARGLAVTMMKLDPYINVDPGTMSRFSTARSMSRRRR
jgi:hypothetical protein